MSEKEKKKTQNKHSRHDRHLTGTAAISVGRSTEQSPLLPFLILVDWTEQTENRQQTLS